MRERPSLTRSDFSPAEVAADALLSFDSDQIILAQAAGLPVISAS